MEVVDDQDTSRLSYSGQWIASDVSGADGGTIHSSSDPSAVVTLRFSGTSVQIDALRSQNGANFTVRLDNSIYGPYSLYGVNATVSNVWSQDRLDASVTHTIELRKAQGSGEALAINVDRFRIASVPSSTITSASTSSRSTTSSSSARSSSMSSLINQCPNTTELSSLPPTSSSLPSSLSCPPSLSSLPPTLSSLPPTLSSSLPLPPSSTPSSSLPTIPSPAMPPFPSETSLDVPDPDEAPATDSVVDSAVDSFQDPPPIVPNSPPEVADESDDPLIIDATSSSIRTSSTLSNSTSSHSSTSHSTHAPAGPLTLTLPAQGTTSPSASNSSDSNIPPQSKTGVILGSVVAVIIASCLLTILVVWIRRRRAKSLENDLRPSTTPAYQTTTASKRILSPLSIYRHRGSPSSGGGGQFPFGRGNSLYTETREYGFGSNSNQVHPGPSPVAHTQSSNSPPVGGASAEGRPISSVEEASAQYTFYPSTTTAAQEFHTSRYAESVSSEYPYTLAFHSGAPGGRP
ncbi:hypothetical protein FRC17_002630 [Serendipita sp. 399]|nr:hypothetical protein FRC17_002630 [Serendipita sp. 399]